LDRRFGVAGLARVVEGNGGLPKVHVTSPDAIGDIYLHGAQVTSWLPKSAHDVLFVGQQSRWEPGRAIRGGVPICFPWFGNKAGDPDAPAHGLVRTRAWRLESIAPGRDGLTVTMAIDSDADTRRWWPADFHLVHHVTLGSTLRLELVVTNTGATPLRFEEALHAYHRVGQIADARVHGLDGIRYLDKTDSNHEKTQQGALAIDSETDRVFLNTRGAIEIDDPVLGRRIRIAKEHSLATVVWNPWVRRARALPDLMDDEWTQFICVETANVSAFAIELAPGEQHTMTALVSVADL
jgi:glucose-6-phosphate 1-epimerase